MARHEGIEIEFSPEGYSRMGENFDFVTDVIRAAVEAGAKIINCPDTIGGACKLQGEEYFVEKMKIHSRIIEKEFPNKNIIWSSHCHNDFGLALENSMNAVFEGPAGAAAATENRHHARDDPSCGAKTMVRARDDERHRSAQRIPQEEAAFCAGGRRIRRGPGAGDA